MLSSWVPTLVPHDIEAQNVYLVVEDFGPAGQAYRETDVERTDLDTVIRDLIAGQYENPLRVVAFNTIEHWADNVLTDVAREIRRRFDAQYSDVPSTVDAFVERHVGHERQLNLRFA